VHCFTDCLTLRAFPARRSSDLGEALPELLVLGVDGEHVRRGLPDPRELALERLLLALERGDPRFGTLVFAGDGRKLGAERAALRSEEHTSELQSRENLVCRLLL